MGTAEAAAEPMRSDSFDKAFRHAGIQPRQINDLVKHVHGKTFYRRHEDGFWYDSDIEAGTDPKVDITVRLWSDAFFDLLKTYPDLRRYVRAADKLVVTIDGNVIRVTPQP
jgi:putative cofactor-binding repeat protein